MSLYSIGEAIIDFLPHNGGYLPVVGGAPANVAACYSLLQKQAYYIGATGKDMFGDMIAAQLKAFDVKTDFLIRTDKANTALSFVTLKADGEREFTFYRNPSADMFLQKEHLKNLNFTSNDILHFCSVDLIDMPVKDATIYAIEKIKAKKGLVSFDPNIRKSLWKDWSEYKKVVLQFLPYADIIKISQDELDFIFDNNNITTIVNQLLKTAKVVLITMGQNGSYCFTKNKQYFQNAFDIKAIDTTGAGDSFIATFLRYADINNPGSLPLAIKKAAAVSAIVCSKKGVFSSLPTTTTLNSFMEKNK